MPKRYAVVEKPTTGAQKGAITKVFGQDLTQQEAARLKELVASRRQTPFAAIIEMPSSAHTSEGMALDDRRKPGTSVEVSFQPMALDERRKRDDETFRPIAVVGSFTVKDGAVTPAKAPAVDMAPRGVVGESPVDEGFDQSDVVSRGR